MIVHAAPPPEIVATPVQAWSPLAIAVDRCKGCGLCVAACPKRVLALDRGDVNVLGYHPVRLTDAGGLHELRLLRPRLPGRRLHRLRPSRRRPDDAATTIRHARRPTPGRRS